MTISLSPLHQAEIDPVLEPHLEEPPTHDLIIRTVARKMANGQPLIQGDLVLAGSETRESYPLARQFPVHFRKTYYSTALHPHPRIEFEHHERAAEILGVPKPIGFTGTEFRSCFIPGKPLDKLLPFGVEPLERNITLARECDSAKLIGLWRLLEAVYEQTMLLHQAGMAHGDLFLHNVIVSLSPIGVYLIDFEQSVTSDSVPKGKSWEQVSVSDFTEVLKHAIWVQCGLGPQQGGLAERALSSIAQLMGDSASSHQRALSFVAPKAPSA